MFLLKLFVTLQLMKFAIETLLATLNKRYYENPERQEEVVKVLKINPQKFQKALEYSRDKYWYSIVSGSINLTGFLIFLYFGGFGYVEAISIDLLQNYESYKILTGLVFFALLGFLSSLMSLPFDYYYTFVLEQKHGFNRQQPSGFFSDWIKGQVIGVILGGIFLGSILWVMDVMGSNWWLWAWLTISMIQLLTIWIYPSLLAPIFNKFTPIQDGALKDEIFSLAEKVNFKASGLFSMDASKRSTHGNAYFTGVFNEKRIVLFDTLLDSLSVKEIIAVLAHELGHFKLNHVRWMLIRGTLMMGLIFYLLSVCLPLEPFYRSFYLDGVSHYGALLVFSLWFNMVTFMISPLGSWLSRRNEFAADKFAVHHVEDRSLLPAALIKLSETNHSMPLAHPIYSFFYHSHPPLMERISAIHAK